MEQTQDVSRKYPNTVRIFARNTFSVSYELMSAHLVRLENLQITKQMVLKIEVYTLQSRKNS